MEAVSRDAVVGDVLKDTTNNTLDHIVMKVTGVMATVNGRLHHIGDGVNHGIHGSNRMDHRLP
jgi:hypothetical protein